MNADPSGFLQSGVICGLPDEPTVLQELCCVVNCIFFVI